MLDNSQSTLPNSIFNAAADNVVPWGTVGQYGYQMPKVKLAPKQTWISSWMGPTEVHSFDSLPDRKVARIGEASILYKPFKVFHLIQIGKGLGQVDHKVFNCLFYYASLDLDIDSGTPAGPVVYQARAADIRRDLGLDAQGNNSQLRHAMERLCSQRVIFPLIRCPKTDEPIVGTLIEDFRLDKGTGILRWSMAPDLRPQNFRYKPNGDYEFWAEIDLDTCRQLSSKYALRLYELMCRLVRMKTPEVKYSVEALRYWLGASTIGTHRLGNWSDFNRRALVASIDEINRVADFTVEMRPQAERWSERVGAVVLALKLGARSK